MVIPDRNDVDATRRLAAAALVTGCFFKARILNWQV
jgi:hypothetical protein